MKKELDTRFNEIPNEQGIEQAKILNLETELKQLVDNFCLKPVGSLAGP